MEQNQKLNRFIDDNFYMNLAIDRAWQYMGLTYPNPAVGALILDKHEKIISVEAHKKAGEPHAEVLAIQEAYYQLTGDDEVLSLSKSGEIHDFLTENSRELFHGFTIYVTLEPCSHYGKTPPCSLLIQKLGFKRVVIGVLDSNSEASGGEISLNISGIETKVLNSQRAKELVEPFQKWQKSGFRFFKYAQTLNGNIKGGVISSESSRKYVHALRDRLDLMVIGGNTVREDRPTLDSRLISGKAPDILIYSKERDFDINIPLFSVPNRQVFIENSLKKIFENRFIMFEGGYSLLNSISEEIDWLLLFVSPKIATSLKIELNQNINFRTLFQKEIGGDIMIWLEKV
jgi:diaminohydroxyphosphoribosylaminopyrimidine deaminase/5-amino-6-(5-phosphoribosylamino)uracil reductase